MAKTTRRERSEANRQQHREQQADGVEPIEPAPTRARASGGGARAGARTGARARVVADQYEADAVESVGRMLRPGTMVRIERMRPQWCAGYIEDYPLDHGGMGELLSYLRDEHGGQLYRVAVLAQDDTELLVNRVPIAGPPRLGGRIINRARWDAAMGGEDAQPAPRHNPAPAPASQRDPLLEQLIAGLLNRDDGTEGRVLDVLREGQRQTMEAVSGLAQLLAQGQQAERESNSFVGQLAQFREGMSAMNELQSDIAASIPEAPGEGSALNTDNVMNEAMKGFLQNAMASQMMKGGIPGIPGQAPSQPPRKPAGNAPQRRVMRRRPAGGANGAKVRSSAANGIPEAGPPPARPTPSN